MWGEPGAGLSLGTGWGQGLYRRGDPVLAVDKGELAVEVIKSWELWVGERETGFTGNSLGISGGEDLPESGG